MKTNFNLLPHSLSLALCNFALLFSLRSSIERCEKDEFEFEIENDCSALILTVDWNFQFRLKWIEETEERILKKSTNEMNDWKSIKLNAGKRAWHKNRDFLRFSSLELFQLTDNLHVARHNHRIEMWSIRRNWKSTKENWEKIVIELFFPL